MNRDNIQIRRVAYPNQSLDSALAATIGKQLVVHAVSAINGSSAANNIAIVHAISPSKQLVPTATVGGVVGVLTLPLAAATSIIGTSTNDGLMIGSRTRFGLIAFAISQAATGTPVYSYQYWNGSAFVTLPTIAVPDFSSTGTKVLLFTPPVDWALDSNSLYSVQIVTTTASGTAIQATNLRPARVLSYRESVPTKGEVMLQFNTGRELLLQVGEDLMAYFAFPSPSNTIEATYQNNP